MNETDHMIAMLQAAIEEVSRGEVRGIFVQTESPEGEFRMRAIRDSHSFDSRDHSIRPINGAAH